MSSDTLAQAPAAPDVPEHADSLTIVPRRRLGQWTAAVAVLVLLALAVTSVLRDIGALYPRILGVKTVDLLGPVTVAIIELTLRCHVEKHCARGSERAR